MGWASAEFETIDLGDQRLNQRAVLLAERLWQKPGASIPGACESWAETAAAYRFLHNAQVGWVESYERIAEQVDELAKTRQVCVGDRKSDILALLVKAHELGYPADYLVRCQHSRVLPRRRPALGSGHGERAIGARAL